MRQKDDSKSRDIWGKISAIGPLLVALVVAFIGGWYNLQQNEIQQKARMQEAYTRIMAQRESSDNTIRSNMFRMLFEAMFKKGFEDIEGTLPGTGAVNWRDTKEQNHRQWVDSTKEKVMFLNLLSRNFETIDIKPLFEDLDEQLLAIIEKLKSHMELMKSLQDGGNQDASEKGRTIDSQLRDAFQLLGALRRIGHNLSIKQINSLSSIAGSKIKYYDIYKDTKGDVSYEERAHVVDGETSSDTDILAGITPLALENGEIFIRLKTEGEFDSPDPVFGVTFYDLPYIDNIHLPPDIRVAIVLSDYISLEEKKYAFSAILNESRKNDIQYLEALDLISWAKIIVIQFPSKYTGLKDRPYLEKIIEDLKEDESERSW